MTADKSALFSELQSRPAAQLDNHRLWILWILYSNVYITCKAQRVLSKASSPTHPSPKRNAHDTACFCTCLLRYKPHCAPQSLLAAICRGADKSVNCPPNFHPYSQPQGATAKTSPPPILGCITALNFQPTHGLACHLLGHWPAQVGGGAVSHPELWLLGSGHLDS